MVCDVPLFGLILRAILPELKINKQGLDRAWTNKDNSPEDVNRPDNSGPQDISERTYRVKITGIMVLLLSVGSTACSTDSGDAKRGVYMFSGTSDASAGVALGEKMFIVADDENNVLRVYETGGGPGPVFSYDLRAFLGVVSGHPEVDLEGATRVGERIYWISSHGRNKDGLIRPNRYRFFATTVKVKDRRIKITPVGRPCRTLVHDLIKAENMRGLGLDRATRFSAKKLKGGELAKLAPKRQGLNIEGLCASPDGKTIYIGFRNPLARDFGAGRLRAIVVALKNAEEVIEQSQRPVFGEPILLDLDGLGIRSMEYSRSHKAYFIVAGPHDQQGRFALYRWSGEKDAGAVLVQPIETGKTKFTPEALVVFDNSEDFWVLSDDGSLVVDVSGPGECMKKKLLPGRKCRNKHLTSPANKTFRGMWLRP